MTPPTHSSSFFFFLYYLTWTVASFTWVVKTDNEIIWMVYFIFHFFSAQGEKWAVAGLGAPSSELIRHKMQAWVGLCGCVQTPLTATAAPASVTVQYSWVPALAPAAWRKCTKLHILLLEGHTFSRCHFLSLYWHHANVLVTQGRLQIYIFHLQATENMMIYSDTDISIRYRYRYGWLLKLISVWYQQVLLV